MVDCYQSNIDDAQKICTNNSRCGGVMELCEDKVCVYEPQFKQNLKPNTNPVGYKMVREVWLTNKLDNNNGNCAYKT